MTASGDSARRVAHPPVAAGAGAPISHQGSGPRAPPGVTGTSCYHGHQVLAATLSAHELAAFGVDVPAGFGGDLCTRRRSGWAVAGVVRPAEEAGERCDGLEQQRVEFGLLVGGALGVEAGDEPIPV